MAERDFDRCMKPLAGVTGRRGALRAAGVAALALLAALGLVDTTVAKDKAKKLQCRSWRKRNSECRTFYTELCEEYSANGQVDLNDCFTHLVSCCDLGKKKCTSKGVSECTDSYLQSRFPV